MAVANIAVYKIAICNPNLELDNTDGKRDAYVKYRNALCECHKATQHRPILIKAKLLETLLQRSLNIFRIELAH